MESKPTDRPPEKDLSEVIHKATGAEDAAQGSSSRKNMEREVTSKDVVTRLANTENNNKKVKRFYSYTTNKSNVSLKTMNTCPSWNNIVIDWKDIKGITVKGFTPDVRQYMKILVGLRLKEEEILRINDCKSGAGFIIITLKETINVISRFEHIKEPTKI
uniref:Uncharacterized protein n=1 Tax=Lepeophtheirus salmonis TaxID=72036 RepID=A0A0K2TKK7_LEPSM